MRSAKEAASGSSSGEVNIYDVAISGAGPVGLSLAIELGRRGRRVVVFERETMRGPQPRAKTLNMRSLMHFRRWGIAEAVRKASPVPADLPPNVVFQTRLFGHHIATIENTYFRGASLGNDPRFCEPSEWVPQHVVEDVLRSEVAALPNVEMLYATEVKALAQTAEQVTVTVADAKGERSMTAAFLVGADGARSTVRSLIGVQMQGRYAFAANYNMVLRIPELNERGPEPRGLMHWTVNADSPVVMGPIGDLWYIAKALEPGVSSMSDADIDACVCEAIGRRVDYEVLTVDPWYAHQLIADRYRQERVFLAGDACHLHPPFGGYGMNMGISDAVDLGWKLDGALAGWGGEALLGSYEFERRRVHHWTIDEAVENYRTLSRELLRPGLEDDTPEGESLRREVAREILANKQREFHTIGLVLGYHYGGSPIIACDENLPPPAAEIYVPEVVCGGLAPHVWLGEGDALYDQFGLGYVVIDTTGMNGAEATLVSAAAQLAVPITTIRRTDEATLAMYGRQLTLVRPDQHVAWHGAPVDLSHALRIMAVATGNGADDDPHDLHAKDGSEKPEVRMMAV